MDGRSKACHSLLLGDRARALQPAHPVRKHLHAALQVQLRRGETPPESGAPVPTYPRHLRSDLELQEGNVALRPFCLAKAKRSSRPRAPASPAGIETGPGIRRLKLSQAHSMSLTVPQAPAPGAPRFARERPARSAYEPRFADRGDTPSSTLGRGRAGRVHFFAGTLPRAGARAHSCDSSPPIMAFPPGAGGTSVSHWQLGELGRLWVVELWSRGQVPLTRLFSSPLLVFPFRGTVYIR